MGCSEHLENGEKKDAPSIAGLLDDCIPELDLLNTCLDLILMDCTGNVQKGGCPLEVKCARATVPHRVKHVVSLFFVDLENVTAASDLIEMHCSVHGLFRFMSMHAPCALFQAQCGKVKSGKITGLTWAVELHSLSAGSSSLNSDISEFIALKLKKVCPEIQGWHNE